MAKILLVEDDKSLREIYGVRLMAEGYDITSAGDGEEALAVAIKERPDLIVSDVMMPKISGFDMLDILRSTTETKNIKVIMMTALSSEDQRARGEALGADRYLVKSQVGIEDVVRTVHDVLGDGIPGAAPAGPTFPSAAAPAATPAAPDLSTPTPTAVTPPVGPTPAAPIDPITSGIPAPLEVEPVIVPAPVEQLVTAPLTQPVAPIAPIEAPIPPQVASTPVVAPLESDPIATPAPIVAAPFSAPAPAFDTPVPAAPIAPTPVPAPTVPATPPVNPIFATPAPTSTPFPAPASTLPQPTAPFSSDPPASLGDRIINPLPSASGLGQPGVADIAAQMNQELNAHLQALDQQQAVPATPVAPATPQYQAPLQPPIPPLPPQPGI